MSCNGVPGTLLVQANGYTGGDGNRRFRIYYWLNPAPGPNTVVVANPNTDPNELALSVILLTNVQQTSPFGDIALDVSTTDRTGESETVNTTTSDLVVHVIGDALFTRGTLGSGETSRSVANDGHHTEPGDGDASLWISTKPGDPSSTNVSSSDWAASPQPAPRVINGVAIAVHGSAPGPTNLTSTAVSSSQINLSWVAAANIAVQSYLIEQCQGTGCTVFAQIGTATGTTFNSAGLTAATSYSYRVRAMDAAGNLTPYSNTASATTAVADTQPPTAPANLSAGAVGNQINLSWTASTDNVGVTQYLVESCQGTGCATFLQIGTAAGTTFSHTGLAAGASYSYRVRASDPSNNFSGYSNVATATTQPSADTTPPTIPTNLAATAAGSTQINLSWTASTDANSPITYRVERCQGAGCVNFFEIATPVATTFSDTGLAANTSYSYRVRASDPSNNFSGYSNVALVAPVVLSAVACNPTSLGPNATSTCTVTLTTAAPIGGTAVGLSSNNTLLTTPTSVTVAAGSSTAAFSATTAAIPSDQSAIVTATLNTVSQSAAINLVASVALSAVACNPTSLGPNASSTCTVTLTKAAPTGGTAVGLSSNNVLLTTPASVTVAAGSSTAAFSATTAAIPSDQSGIVTATLNSVSQSATVNLVAPVVLSAVACNPTSLGPNASSTCTVTLTKAAPTGGTAVTLSSNNALLTTPASVTVAAGSTTATFSATTAAIPSDQSATVTATLNSVSQSATVNLVAPVVLSSVACNPTSLGPNATSTCTVTLTKAAPTGGTAVGLSSNNALLTTPASVTVAAGSSTAAFSATTAAIPNDQSASVTATLNSVSQSAAINLVASVAVVSSVACTPTSLGPNATSTCTVTLTKAAPTGGTAVGLSSNNALLTTPASVTVAAGSSTAAFSATTAAIPNDQSASVTATLNSVSQSAAINLVAPVALSAVACNPTSLGPNATSTCTVTLTKAAPTGGTAVGLSSNNALLTTPASVTVAAGSTTATFSATTAAIPSDQSATVTATLNTVSQSATVNLTAPWSCLRWPAIPPAWDPTLPAPVPSL